MVSVFDMSYVMNRWTSILRVNITVVMYWTWESTGPSLQTWPTAHNS